MPKHRTRAVFAFLVALAAAAPAAADGVSFATDELWIESRGERHRFRVELAETPAQQARGLMFRTDVPADSGMLFLYGGAKHVAMWMKNTLVPLDMLFVAADGAVARIERWTEPLSLASIPSGAPVAAVLELRGGTADRLGLAAGDRVVHAFFETAGAADGGG